MNQKDLILKLKDIVGKRYVLTGNRQTERFRKGFRSGEGKVLAVIRPGKLIEQWQILKACIKANVIVIMQAANTGLTEGSTPNGEYDRDVVLINTTRINNIHLINSSKQVICLAGATLYKLENLLKPINRVPHSVIGSSCIGASVIGGVCNNSGGSLIERGPSYTEFSIFAQINIDGELEFINNLGIDFGENPEEILNRLEKGEFSESDILPDKKNASDKEYIKRVRDIKAVTPARFNADKRRLYEASGCAGKLAVFAVRLDSYPMNHQENIFYIGTNNSNELSQIRKAILKDFKTLPVSAEYMHRDVFDITKEYGKDTVIFIDILGTDWMPKLFAIKAAVDSYLNRISFIPQFLTDRLMQFMARLYPNVLPKRMLEYRAKFEHYLILKAKNEGIEETEIFLNQFFADSKGNFFICNERESKIAELHRFAAAGAAIRYKNIHRTEVEDIIALDIALPRNTKNWREKLPQAISDQMIHRLYYGHFLCYVFHQDYIVKKGTDTTKLKSQLLSLLDEKNAEYPAEHNVGHLYYAKKDLANFYQSIDPTNSLNPGIGKMNKRKNYAT